MVKSNTRTKGPASTRTKEPVHGQKGQYTDKSARTRTKGPKVQDPNPECELFGCTSSPGQ